MNYLLVKEEQLNGQGYDYRYAERIPDGRIILPLSALKVLSNFSPEIIDDDSLKALIKEQQESGEYNQPIEGGATDGATGEELVDETPAADEEQHTEEGGNT